MTYNNVNLTGYGDGTNANSEALSGNLDNTDKNWWIGGGGNSANNFQGWLGIIDEPRLASVARSSGWILTEYSNQIAPANFRILGPLETNNNTYKVCGYITGDITNNITMIYTDGTNYTNQSAANGYYEIELLPGSLYTIRPLSNAFSFNPASYTISLLSNLNTNYNFSSSPGYILSGYTLNLNNDPVSGVTISLIGTILNKSTNTDENGYYSFDVNNDMFTLLASGNGYKIRNSIKTITIDNTNSENNNFIAEGYFTISGIVSVKNVNTTNTAAKSIWVFIGGDTISSNLTGSGGNYSFSVMPGSYFIYPLSNGYTISPDRRSVSVTASSLSNMHFELLPALYELSGYILDMDKNPYENIRLILDEDVGSSVYSDSEGYYIFRTGYGSHTIKVTDEKFEFIHIKTNIIIETRAVSNVNFQIFFNSASDAGKEINFSRGSIINLESRDDIKFVIYKKIQGFHSCEIILSNLNGQIVKKIFNGQLGKGIHVFGINDSRSLRIGISILRIKLQISGRWKYFYKILTILK